MPSIFAFNWDDNLTVLLLRSLSFCNVYIKRYLHAMRVAPDLSKEEFRKRGTRVNGKRMLQATLP